MIKINKESDIWNKFLKIKIKSWIRRIECKSISSGFPDIVLLQKDEELLFVENKIVDKLYFDGLQHIHYVRPKVKPSQVRWMIQYPKDACFLIYVKEEKKFLIENGKCARALAEGYHMIWPDHLLTEDQVLKTLLNYTRIKNGSQTKS